MPDHIQAFPIYISTSFAADDNNDVAPVPVGMVVCGGNDVSEEFHMLTHRDCSADALFGYLTKEKLNEG